MIDLTVELELEYDKVLSLVLIDYNHFLEWENVLPFYRNVKTEGIVLWNGWSQMDIPSLGLLI